MFFLQHHEWRRLVLIETRRHVRDKSECCRSREVADQIVSVSKYSSSDARTSARVCSSPKSSIALDASEVYINCLMIPTAHLSWVVTIGSACGFSNVS